MKKLNLIKGQLGEDLATKYLKKKRYKVIYRNYKNKIGEIDIIAEWKDLLIFVEVKSRSSKLYGLPCEAVDERKQAKIKKVAQVFLFDKKYQDKQIRFDVIEILEDQINHIENAF